MFANKICRSHTWQICRSINKFSARLRSNPVYIILCLSPITACTNDKVASVIYQIRYVTILVASSISVTIKSDLYALIGRYAVDITAWNQEICICQLFFFRSNQSIEIPDCRCLSCLAGAFDAKDSLLHNGSGTYPQLQQIV